MGVAIIEINRIVMLPEMLLAANGHVQRKDTRENVLSSAENIADEEENVDRPQASQQKTNPVWLTQTDRSDSKCPNNFLILPRRFEHRNVWTLE